MGMHWKHPLMKDGWKVQLEATNKGVEFRVLDDQDNAIPYGPSCPFPAENIKRAIKRAIKVATEREQE